MIGLALFLVVQQPDIPQAESLLATGRAFDAARIMERVVARRPEDPAAHVLLGRAHLARPVVGRYSALQAFRAAARLAPSDAAALYWQTEVGLYLGSDEGEGIAREALLDLMAIDPDYRDSWSRFRRLFGNAPIWRRADAALARHGDALVALERRAELALLLDDPARAESLLARAARLGARSAAVPLLRAEAAFRSGNFASGYAWTDSALARAADDSTGALWSRFWPIASPAEREAYAMTLPVDRGKFFALFLGRRDPDLTTPENERVTEHFARLAHARRHFRLLHPLNQYHRSALVRGVTAVNSRALLRDLTIDAPALFLGAPTARARAAAGLGLHDRDFPSTDSAGTTLFALAGLDARGLLWVRHGQPDQRIVGTLDALRPAVDGERALDVESWVYDTPDGPISVGFRRGTGGVFGFGEAGGDFVFEPISDRQVRWTGALLRTDNTALPARLDAPAWVAFFRDESAAGTAVYVRTRPGRAAAALWGVDGLAGRVAGEGLLRLSAAPGTYDIGIDVDSAGSLGRVRGAVTVPEFAPTTLALSSLVLGDADSLGDRDATLRAMPADLTFMSGAQLAAYAEIYALSTDSNGLAHYRVRYAFMPLRGPLARLFAATTPLVLEFDRAAPGASTVVEQIVIAPGRLPRGRHRVTLSVTDLLRNVKTETVATDLVVR